MAEGRKRDRYKLGIVKPTKKTEREECLYGSAHRWVCRHAKFVRLGVIALLWCFPTLVVGQQSAQQTGQLAEQQATGNVSGTIVDSTGAVVAGARVTLRCDNQSANLESITSDDGQFSFVNVWPGNFQLTITARGFATQTSSGTLHAGEIFTVPQIQLAIATAVTQVEVTMTPLEMAEKEVKEEESSACLE